MKGLELPINMIIVIAIAVLVLVVVSAFFAGQTGTGFGTITDTAALDRGCALWRQAQPACTGTSSTINIPGYTAAGANGGSTLNIACTRVLGSTQTDAEGACRTRCGCP